MYIDAHNYTYSLHGFQLKYISHSYTPLTYRPSPVMNLYSSHPDKGLNVKYNVAIILQISKFAEVKGDVS